MFDRLGGGKGPPSRNLVILAVAAMAGTVALYVMDPSGGNVFRDRIEPIPRPAVVAVPGGEMAAFVPRATPVAAPEVVFQGPGGVDTGLEAFKGKVVLLNLWATWCAPCRKEMPALDRLQAQLGGDDFEVVALALDRGGETAARRFFDEIGVKNLKLFIDPTARLGARFNVVGLPATLLLNRQGEEIGRLMGPAEWDSADAVGLIQSAIAAK